MWTVTNRTPFETGAGFVRGMQGEEIWVVAVKGTFQIHQNASLSIAKEQMPVCLSPEFFGEAGNSSLKYDRDLILEKPNTDVILHGHAYSPEGREVQEMNVEMKVGNIYKSLKVIGKHGYQERATGIGVSEPQPFTKIALTYENTYGGTDEIADNPKLHGREFANPVGCGFSVKSSHLDGNSAPSVFYTSEAGLGRKTKTTPASFAPIPQHWPPRIHYTGTYDEKWSKERSPLLPHDFDSHSFQSAPKDQQAYGYLQGGEQVYLSNLTPSGWLAFNLPQIDLTFRTQINQKFHEHSSNLHTLILEPDESRFMMVWHTAFPCHRQEHLLNKTIVTWSQTNQKEWK